MTIIYNIMIYFGIGLRHIGNALKWVGEWLEDFATRKLNG
jgi:hypothetical protein